MPPTGMHTSLLFFVCKQEVSSIPFMDLFVVTGYLNLFLHLLIEFALFFPFITALIRIFFFAQSNLPVVNL